MKLIPQVSNKSGSTSHNLQKSDQSPTDIVFYNITNPSNRSQCDECKRDITKSAKLLLRSNDNCFLDLCVSCFANVEEYQREYHAINKLEFPLFELEWNAEEELLLFEGLEKHGFGNWGDIADFIGNNKTLEEVEEHYQQIYLKSHAFIPTAEILSRRDHHGLLVQPERESHGKKQSKGMKQNNNSSANLNRNAQAANQAPKVNTSPAQIVGFMPRRGDFQIEYDNDAELLLAEMEFNDDDTEEEKAMKFRLIDIYNHKLNQRIKRKDFVISRKLLDIREQMRLDKTRTKEEKEIYNIMKVFARFNTPEDHDKLVQGIIKEKQIRQRIAQLRELKGKGFRTLGDVEDQLDGKKKKDDKSKKRDIQPYGMDKSKTRRVRKDTTVERSEKRVLYVNKQEQQLCRRLNMTFRQYMTIKQTVLRESVRLGLINRDETTRLFQVNKPIAEAVYDFLVEQEGLFEQEREERHAQV